MEKRRIVPEAAVRSRGGQSASFAFSGIDRVACVQPGRAAAPRKGGPMTRFTRMQLVLPLALLIGACSHPTVLVPVPPRMDLKGYPVLGIVEFASTPERELGARAARQFQEQVQSAQPGTRFIELGERDAVLAGVGAKQFDAAALRKIGEKYGIAALFVGELAYSEPTVDVKFSDITKLQGGMRAEMKGDISSRLVETATGASVWSRSAWAKRQLGGVNVSGDGVSGGARSSNPREAMLPTLVHELTHDFRPT